MSSNKIIQSDNAVIDYTTISVLIDTVNKQQDQIDQLIANATNVIVNPDGSTASGKQVIDSGHTLYAGATTRVTFKKIFTSPPDVVAFCSSQDGVVRTAYLGKATVPTKTYVDVNVSPAPPSSKGYIWWIAVGNG
jgi:hypothetical protein